MLKNKDNKIANTERIEKAFKVTVRGITNKGASYAVNMRDKVSGVYITVYCTNSRDLENQLESLTGRSKTKEAEHASLEVDKVFYNEGKKSTTVMFSDGEVVKVKASEGTDFNRHSGLTSAITKKIFKSSRAINRLVDSGVEQVSKVRKK